MSWPTLSEVISGSVGACVEALALPNTPLSGDPAICHVLNFEGNAMTAAWTGSIPAAEWNSGKPRGGPDEDLGVRPLGLETDVESFEGDF